MRWLTASKSKQCAAYGPVALRITKGPPQNHGTQVYDALTIPTCIGAVRHLRGESDAAVGATAGWPLAAILRPGIAVNTVREQS